MVFSSPGFLFLFFPVFFALYFVMPRAARNSYILLASFFFYILGAGALTVVALVLLMLNWMLGHLIGRLQGSAVVAGNPGAGRPGAGNPGAARLALAAGIAMNLAPLIFFKYMVFLAQVLHDMTGMAPFATAASWKILLPLGISFYVFHFLSYLLDVHARRIAPETSIQKFAIYIFLFPHLIAGPVVRYAEVREHLNLKYRRLVGSDVFWGMVIFAIGLAKKMLVADPLGAVVDAVHAPTVAMSTYAAWLGAVCYSFQIYFDFSGYTDMAIGMARMMGFRFPRNFNRPYAAASITEFWQRWHMTLSRFFRDYVYIPLGGNRRGNLLTYRNSFIVFGLCALWHGAAYTFLIWGLGHGALLALERAGILNTARWRLGSLPVFVLATVLWVPFRAVDLGQTGKLLRAMSGLDPAVPLWQDANRVLADPKVLFLLALASLVCLLGDKPFARLRRRSLRQPLLLGLYSCLLYLLSCLAVVEGGFNPFIYFQF